MKYETDEMEIMANYLNHKGFDIQKTEYDGMPAWEINDLPVDDPMDLRPMYDRDMADLLDGWDGKTDITLKDGFHDLFVKGKIHSDAPEGCARYDGLFRNTIVFVSVRPDELPTIWLENSGRELMPDAVGGFRVRRINKAIDHVTGKPTLYMRITGGIWENICELEEIE